MKTWKLVSGILCMVMFVFVSFQSCAAGIADAMADSGGLSGGAGLITSVLMLAGGIVSVAVRNSEGKGGDIALTILFGIAALIGFTMAGNFKDLNIWAGCCLLCAVTAVISMMKKKGTK